MKRIVILAGLLGVAAVGAKRLFKSNEGTITGGANRAADSVRRQGPRLADNVAVGIEKMGSATEKGASTLRVVTEKGTATIRERTSSGESDDESKAKAS